MTSITKSLKQRAQAVIDLIYEEEYYIRIWESVQHQRPIDDIDNEPELLKPFQEFWSALPDTTNIRRIPFFAVCDLAEKYMCLEGEE